MLGGVHPDPLNLGEKIFSLEPRTLLISAASRHLLLRCLRLVSWTSEPTELSRGREAAHVQG